MDLREITLASGAHCTVAMPDLGLAAEPRSNAAPGQGPRRDSRLPLIISLHYGGPVSPWYGRGLLEQVVVPALSELTAVMIAPDCPADRWSDDICDAGVIAAMDYAIAELDADPARVLLTGYSLGGIGTWAITAAHPGRFSAAIVMAGLPPTEVDPSTWQVPVHAIQAGADELMPVAKTRAWIDALQAHNVAASLTVLDDVTHFETHQFVAPLRATVPWIKSLWWPLP